MGIFKKIKTDDLNEHQERQMELVVELMTICKNSMSEGDSSLAVGAMATTLATIMAAILHASDKDASMDIINELLSDIKKGIFIQIEMIQQMGNEE